MGVSSGNSKTYSVRSVRRDGPFGYRYYALLYAIESPIAQRIKIGRTTDIGKRYGGLCTASPVQLILRGSIWLPQDAESYAHEYLRDSRCHGEWFTADEKTREFAALIEAKDHIQLSTLLGMDYMLMHAVRSLAERT